MLALSDTCRAALSGQGGLCGCLTPAGLGRLRAVAGDARLEAGEVLFRRGDAALHLYGVRHGAMMLSRVLDGKRRQVLSFHFAGDMLGFAGDDPHQATATALGRVGLCRIPLARIGDDAALAGQVLAVLQANVVRAQERLLLLGRMSAAERVAAALVELWRRLGGGPELHLPMRLVDLADYLGLRPETVSREMALLRRRGLIGPLSPEGVLPVLAPEALA